MIKYSNRHIFVQKPLFARGELVLLDRVVTVFPKTTLKRKIKMTEKDEAIETTTTTTMMSSVEEYRKMGNKVGPLLRLIGPEKDDTIREKMLIVLADCAELDANVRKDVLLTAPREGLSALVTCLSDRRKEFSKPALRTIAHCTYAEFTDPEEKRRAIEHVRDSDAIEELVDMLSSLDVQKDSIELNRVIVALGNFANDSMELRNEIRACGGVEDLVDAISRGAKSAEASIGALDVFEAGVLALENLTNDNRKNTDAFVQSNGVETILGAIASPSDTALGKLVASGQETKTAALRLLDRAAESAAARMLPTPSTWVAYVLRTIDSEILDSRAERTQRALATRLLAQCLRLAPTADSTKDGEKGKGTTRTQRIARALHEQLERHGGVEWAVRLLRRQYVDDAERKDLDRNGDASSKSSSTSFRTSEELEQTAWLVLGRCVRVRRSAIREFCETKGVDLLLCVLCDLRSRGRVSAQREKTVGMAAYLLSIVLFACDAMRSEDATKVMEAVWAEGAPTSSRPIQALLQLLRHRDPRVQRHALLCFEGLKRHPHAARRFVERNLATRFRMLDRRTRDRETPSTKGVQFAVAAQALSDWTRSQFCDSVASFEAATDRLARPLLPSYPSRERELEARGARSRLAKAIVESGACRNVRMRRIFCRRGGLGAMLHAIGRSAVGGAATLAFLRDMRPLIVSETATRLARESETSAGKDASADDEEEEEDRGVLASIARRAESKRASQSLRVDEDEADVCFVVGSERKRFFAHRSTVVESCSGLRRLVRVAYRTNETTPQCVEVEIPKDVTYRAFKAIMTFAYTGSTARAVRQDNLFPPPSRCLVDLLVAGRALRVPEVTEAARHELEERLNPETACEILELSAELEPPAWGLGRAAFECALTHYTRLAKRDRPSLIRALRAYLPKILT